MMLITRCISQNCPAEPNIGRYIASPVSGQNFLYNLSMDIGQTEISTCITVCQLFVIKSQQVQQRGVQIVHVDLVLDRFMSELVGGTMGKTGL